MLKDIELEKIISFLNRKPNVLETAMFDTMWSEHCSYKSTKHWFKLFKDITSPRVKLGMGEGAGLIDVGDGQIIGFKMESHNHPSAIDPFNGAATGVGGIIRDILSQGCQPIALLDSLRFGDLSDPHTQFLFENVVRGISSYGNCVGIPNIGGDIIFDSSYQRNCLVNVMCIGIVDESHIIHSKASKTGNKLVVFGSRTGRDGIGGVSFASLDLTESSEKSRSSVQIGDPALEKVLIDVVQDLIFADLINGMQDLGGGGLTCAASEIVVAGEKGVIINIDKLPLREEGMHPWEIMISESQERMIVVVDEKKIGSVKEILEKHDVYYGIVGEVIDEDKIVITNNNKDILANLPASFLVNGFISFNHPQKPIEIDNLANYPKGASDSIIRNFTKLLSSVNIGSKEFIYSQYDKTVQSRTILEPGDNAGVLDIGHGKAIGAVMDTNDYQVSINPKIGTIKAILRCFGKLNATGLEPLAMVDCLNFGNPERPESYWQFVQAVEGLSEAASSLQLPVIGGNVSLYNENDSKVGSNRIHPTPSIGILGLTNNNQCICTQKVKFSNSYMFIIGNMNFSLKGSEYERIKNTSFDEKFIRPDIELNQVIGSFIRDLISKTIISASKYISRGGLASSFSQMVFGTKFGLNIKLNELIKHQSNLSLETILFGELDGSYLIEVPENMFNIFIKLTNEKSIIAINLGRTTNEDQIIINNFIFDLQTTEKNWRNSINMYLSD